MLRVVRRVGVPHAVAVLLIGAAVAASFRGQSAAAAGQLVQSLTYVGKFSLPAGFEYGGRGLAFNPARNSLFASGFTRSPITAEVSIPGVGGTATVLQPLTDPTEGRSGQVNPGDPNDKVTGGYLVSGNSLIVSVYAYYDGSGNATLSHFVRPLSLSTRGQVVGPVRVGPLGAGYYAGYMADVPAEWQAAFGGPALTGQAEISIVSRTSYGPAAFAFDPNRMSSSGAVPLVYYDTAHQNLGAWGHPATGVPAANPYPYYGIADEITGLVFPQGTSSVLFFGRHGTTTCYGDGAPCGDPTDNSKGTHGYPYQPVMLVYNANDLAAVKAGTRKPWDVQPAAKWVLPFSDATGAYHISGAAYDPVTGRIYVGQYFTTGARSIVHVFQVDSVSDTTAPVLSGIGSSNLTSSGATIGFTTNEPSYHQVEYGPTTTYGTTTALDTTLRTSHSQVLTGLTPGRLYHYRARATDAAGNRGTSGDFTFTTPATGQPPAPTPISIWSASAAPSTFATADPSSVELGLKFRSDVAGKVTGVRFYKGTMTTGTHTGTLWSASGTKLASATFSGESASGWQTVAFSSPVTIAANTVYVVSYHSNVGLYAYTANAFTSAGVDNGPLHALRAGVSGANGVYTKLNTVAFPTSSYNSSNYWVDITFVPGS
ncbi:MAG: DUF4082 domain-containing protein [Acidobacteriota bacterium]